MKINKNLLFTISLLTIVISGIVGYSYLNSDINSTSNVTINKYSCNQANLYDRLACMSVMDNVKSKYVSSSTGINFSTISSDTNGKGIYTFSSTAGDEYPIYYYRGEVDNNNVKFAGFCWKIVRTTDTGGTKLIYNGTPDTNGFCTKTEDETKIEKSVFNNTTNDNSLAYAGYMYGEVYSYHSSNIEDYIWYGDNFTFTDVDTNVSGDGTYKLSNLVNDSSKISSHHYTCWNSSGECSKVSYIYYVDYENNEFYYINIRDGKNIQDAISEMNENTNDSTVKTSVDNWFNNTFTTWFTNNSHTPNDYLEDAIWCNDRTISSTTNGWNSNGNIEELLYYEGYKRREESNPSLKCNNKNDSFTESDTTKGNGKLTYRVGLITADEVILAGGINLENSNYYLRNQTTFWTMTPYKFDKNWGGVFGLYSDGKLDYHGIGDSKGVRPMISLNHSQVIASGDGTQNNPYIIN